MLISTVISEMKLNQDFTAIADDSCNESNRDMFIILIMAPFFQRYVVLRYFHYVRKKIMSGLHEILSLFNV